MVLVVAVVVLIVIVLLIRKKKYEVRTNYKQVVSRFGVLLVGWVVR